MEGRRQIWHIASVNELVDVPDVHVYVYVYVVMPSPSVIANVSTVLAKLTGTLHS